jgi:hypothetical protein
MDVDDTLPFRILLFLSVVGLAGCIVPDLRGVYGLLIFMGRFPLDLLAGRREPVPVCSIYGIRSKEGPRALFSPPFHPRKKKQKTKNKKKQQKNPPEKHQKNITTAYTQQSCARLFCLRP